jgi:hypothetical protein
MGFVLPGYSFGAFVREKITLTECFTVLLELVKKQGQTGFFSR